MTKLMTQLPPAEGLQQWCLETGDGSSGALRSGVMKEWLTECLARALAQSHSFAYECILKEEDSCVWEAG
jgi:hypothetical protein